MSKKTGSGRRFMIAKNLIMMLATLAAILVAIFAWFSQNTKAEAEGIYVRAKTGDLIELAVPDPETGEVPLNNKAWSPTLDFRKSGYLQNLVKDVTSSGEQFVIPDFEASKGLKDGRQVIASSTWAKGLSTREALTNEIANDDDQYNYISLDFYVRARTNNLNVAADSYLAAGSEKGIGENPSQTTAQGLTGAHVYRHSSYGAGEKSSEAFSADAVVGAMRVSLVGAQLNGVDRDDNNRETTYYNGTDNGTWNNSAAIKFLWLPRPDLYLHTSNNQNEWRLYTGILPSGNQDSSYQNGLTGAQLDEIAAQNYSHTFYKGKMESNIQKGLKYQQYFDQAYTTAEDVDNETTFRPSYFKVSKVTANTFENGNLYPTLGQSADIDFESQNTSDITFEPEDIDDTRETTGYYVYKYSLNIWIEGEDAEARRSMNTGVFSLVLNFEG